MATGEQVLEAGSPDKNNRIAGYVPVFVMEFITAPFEISPLAEASRRLYGQAVAQMPPGAQVVNVSAVNAIPVGRADAPTGEKLTVWFISLTACFYHDGQTKGLPQSIEHLVDTAAAAGARVQLEQPGDVQSVLSRLGISVPTGRRREWRDTVAGIQQAAVRQAGGGDSGASKLDRRAGDTVDDRLGDERPGSGPGVGRVGDQARDAELPSVAALQSPSSQIAEAPDGRTGGGDVAAAHHTGHRYPDPRDLS